MTDDSAPNVTRRGALASGAALLGAGCLGSGGGDAGTSTGAPTATLETHPAGRDLSAQPRLGSADATATIVAFEDPSCPRCANFERTTVRRIRSELVEPGKATFVARTVPVVYPWGEPAIHALEATFAREADAFWTLLDYYFDHQQEFDTGNVLDRTRAFLSEETDLDAAGIVADAEEETYGDAVETDLDASEAANVSGTPTVFLFRDGEYRTRAAGSVSYDLVTRSLGL